VKKYPDMAEIWALKETVRASLSPEEQERRWQLIKRGMERLWAQSRNRLQPRFKRLPTRAELINDVKP
jgi:hypothetical protein